LKSARLLEPFGMVWIDRAMKRGRGRNFAFALVKTK
jgi:8-hydroxy-5-deazaflavin:NADPH oxidoreductase